MQHLWQKKTFWETGGRCVCLDDIESMSHEDVETVPPVPSEKHSAHVRLVVERMRQLKAQFDTIIRSGSSPSSSGGNARSGGSGRGNTAGTKVVPGHRRGGSGGGGNVAIAHDMAKFWHRKSKKAVLAVLLVLKEDEGTNAVPKLYTGTNMEVSERRD